MAVGFALHDLELLPTADEDRVVGHLGPDLLGDDWEPRIAAANLTFDPDRPLAETLLDLGFVATTNAMGAGKWRVEHSAFLHGRRVCLLL